MCGVAGWYCWGDARPDVALAQWLLLAQQPRGIDAAGLAYLNRDGNIAVVKQRGPAIELVRALGEQRWAEIAASPRAMFHARATTRGTAHNNENNHPVVGFGWVVVHNGQVANDDDLWQHYSPKERFAEVDTSAIPLVLSRSNSDDLLDHLRYVSILSGSVTAAVWPSRWPDRIALVRLQGADLFLFFDADKNILYWSSVGTAGRLVGGRQLGAVRFLNVAKVPPHRVLVLSPGNPPVRVYAVTPRPFYRPRVHRPVFSPGLVASRPAPVATTAATVGVPVSIKVHPSSVEKLPFPRVPPADRFRWETWEELQLEGARGTTVFDSAYGVWTLTPAGNFFKPVRSLKKFLRQQFGEVPQLPLPAQDEPPKWDHKLPLWRLVLAKQENGVSWQLPGYICPWCGIWARASTWNLKWRMRCPYCGIASHHAEGNNPR